MRRPDDGKFLPKDAAKWRGLLKQARYLARAPLADAYPLLKAADRCGKAVPPAGQARRDSDFLKLVMLGRLFWRLNAAERQVRAGELAVLADACERALDAPPPGAGRADIFG